MEKKDIEKLLAGAFATFIFCFLIIIVSPSFPVRRIEVYERADKPNIIRIYKPGRDGIFVENKEDNQFTYFSTYLKTIPDKAIREQEKVDIKTTIGWYK